MNINDLPWLLRKAHKICDEEWKKLGPERRKRICDNITKRAMARAERRKHKGSGNG